MKKNWIYIILLTLSSLSLAGTAAYFSIFGLAKLFHGAGIGIIILASVLEFSKLVAVSYVYRYWSYIAKALRVYYILGILFIMLLTSIGIYGFLTSSYQSTVNNVEMRDSKIKIANNKKDIFISQLERIDDNIKNSTERINSITEQINQREKRLNSLYDKDRISSAKRTENQISGSDEQIKILNDDKTKKISEAKIINDSISYYDQKIVEYKSSDVSSEIGPLIYLSDLTGYNMNQIVNILVLLIIFVFDPMAITLLIAVNQLTMLNNNNNNNDKKNNNKNYINKIFKKIKNKKKIKDNIKTVDNKNYNLGYNDIENETLDNNEGIEDDFDNNEILEDNDNIENYETLYENENNEIDNLENDFSSEIEYNDKQKNENKIVNLDIKELKKGMNVYHDIFGEGTVIKYDNNRVFIRFKDGIKELLPEYANLKKIVENIEIEKDTFDDNYDIKEKPTEKIENDYIIVNDKWVDPNTPWIVHDNFKKIKKNEK